MVVKISQEKEKKKKILKKKNRKHRRNPFNIQNTILTITK